MVNSATKKKNNNDRVECTYKLLTWTLSGLSGDNKLSYQMCKTSYNGFSAGRENHEFEFSGIAIQKSSAKLFHMVEPTKLDFLPSKLFKTLPNLVALSFDKSPIKTLKDGFFSSDCKKIEFVNMVNGVLRNVEENAFAKMPNLRCLLMAGNVMKSLSTNFIEFNPLLVYLSFKDNHIKSINPEFFAGHNNLQSVNFGGNVCAHDFLKVADGAVAPRLPAKLATCYAAFKAERKG